MNDEVKRQGLKTTDELNSNVEGAELQIVENLDFGFLKPSGIAVEINVNDLEECLKKMRQA